MAMCPSQIWYLMLASEVRPMSCKTDDPLVTGKKRKARQMFPTRPSVRPDISNLATHLPNRSNQISLNYCIIQSESEKQNVLVLRLLSIMCGCLLANLCKHSVQVRGERPNKQCNEHYCKWQLYPRNNPKRAFYKHWSSPRGKMGNILPLTAASEGPFVTSLL